MFSTILLSVNCLTSRSASASVASASRLTAIRRFINISLLLILLLLVVVVVGLVVGL